MYCSQCGLCCKKLNRLNLPEQYKYLDNGEGVCKYLKGKLCTIYNHRPDICNSKKMYELLYYKQFETYEKFENYLVTCCHLIQGENQ